MAKWGEGDPRWIVEERADSHNVNNWHWKEVDANKWSEKKLKELLEGMVVEDGPYQFEMQKDLKVNGESMASNRKNKLIAYWDYTLEAKFKLKHKGNEVESKGTIKCPNFSQENDPDEWDLTSTKYDKDEHYDAEGLKFIKAKAHPVLRDKMEEYGKLLRSDFAASVCQVTTANSPAKSAQSITTNMKKVELNKPVEAKKSTTTKTSSGSQIKTKKLLLKETFMCTVAEVYNVFIDKQRVNAWTRGAMQSYNPDKNGEFVLFGGVVTGTFVELEQDKKIVMKWRLRHWPAAHFSTASMAFEQTDKGAKMTLEQSGVPESDIERTKQGWKEFYWNPIKFTFGFGITV